MRVRLCRLLLLVTAGCALAAPAVAQPGAPIRLKARTFVPAANVAPNTRLERAMPGAPHHLAPRRHVLIQFAGPIDRAALGRLRQAGAVPLRYVPDNTIAASVPAGFDPAALDGVRWVGGLQPADRLSAETARDLAAAVPRHGLTIAEFHADVPRGAIEQVLAAAGIAPVRHPGLPPYTALIPTDASGIQQLAGDERVAWIYPAAENIETLPAAICEGVLRPEGLVANYAAMGDGWDGPGRGPVRLGYFLSRPSIHLDPGTQLHELTRAMLEWSRHAAIRWEPAPSPGSAATIDVLWGPRDHGDGFPFAPGVLAHAFYPAPPVPEPIAGDVHFNDTFLWGVGPGAWDVFSVALHELGHSLGLTHSGDPGAVMYPFYRGAVAGLAPGDVAAIRELYAPARGEVLAGGWTSAVVGGDASGGVTAQDGRFVVTAGGRDIWDGADEFRFVARPLAADGDIVARVDALDGAHRWTKAGVMIRDTVDPASSHAFLLVSRDKGIAFQRRRSAGAPSVHTGGGAGTAPQWLWLSRRGPVVDAYAAVDGGEWRFVGSDTIALGGEALAGLAVTSHDVAGTATAVFSQVTVTAVEPPAWTGADIGDVGRAGSWSSAGSRVVVGGAGADIWDTADAFHFVWQPIEGDVDVVAHVASLTRTRSWAKAGVMIRGSLDPGGAHAFMLASAARGFAFQRRPVPGGLSLHTPAGAGAAPGWVKLSRRGDWLGAYRSADAVAWTFVGAEIIPMEPVAYVGLAVSSHTAASIAQAVFDRVSVVRVGK